MPIAHCKTKLLLCKIIITAHELQMTDYSTFQFSAIVMKGLRVLSAIGAPLDSMTIQNARRVIVRILGPQTGYRSDAT